MLTDDGGGEWLLRRIPEEWGPTSTDPRPSPLAFRPHRDRDVDGLSLYRESKVTPEELAAWGRTGKTYFVARVRLSDLRSLGMTLLDTEDKAGRPGHVCVPEMKAANRTQPQQALWQTRLAEMCEIEGPYPGMTPVE